jgi:3-hydroxybutyrate dehydrogenase
MSKSINKQVVKQVVLITGAARGIGLEIGKTFARDGATVILSDINEGRSGQTS